MTTIPEKRKTVEELEALAKALAADRDAARDTAARWASENRVLRLELKPMLERVSAMIGGSVAAGNGARIDSLDERVSEAQSEVERVKKLAEQLMRNNVMLGERFLVAKACLEAVSNARTLSKTLKADVKATLRKLR